MSSRCRHLITGRGRVTIGTVPRAEEKEQKEQLVSANVSMKRRTEERTVFSCFRSSTRSLAVPKSCRVHMSRCQ